MGGGGKNNPINQVSHTISQGVQAVGNYYGFDNSGKWTNKTGILHAADEGIGELTGRNQSRAALNFAKDQYATAQTQANNLILQQNWDRQNLDQMASGAAGAARASGFATSGANYNNTAPGGFGSSAPANKDFLGL